MDVDLNLLRSAVTVLSLMAFVGIVAWAWSSRRKADFEEMARVVFSDEPMQPSEANSMRAKPGAGVELSQLQCAAWAGAHSPATQAPKPGHAITNRAAQAGYGSLS